MAMRPVALSVSFLIAAAGTPSVRAQQRPPAVYVADARIDRLERWVKAAARHQPGTADEAAIELGSWPGRDLQTLWVDVDVLITLMRHTGQLRFSMRSPGQRTAQDIHHTPTQLRRLRALACAAVGIGADRHCYESKDAIDRDADLVRLSALALAARSGGDGNNYILRRGALLHADVAMLVVPNAIEPASTSPSPGPQRFKMQISDGRQTDFGEVAMHWEIARAVLDSVQPAGDRAPAPGRDAMVRQWYRATAAWMQQAEDHDTVHLDHARELFPTDPDILFLSGTQHETYAAARIQSAVQTAALPSVCHSPSSRNAASSGRPKDISGARWRSPRTTSRPGCGWDACWGSSGGMTTRRENFGVRCRPPAKKCCATTASCFSAPKKKR